MNTYNLPARPLYTLAGADAARVHAGPQLPGGARARRARAAGRSATSTSFSGYGEGWGLYTEWLGTVMGIYETPYEDFGRLTYEMWRAMPAGRSTPASITSAGAASRRWTTCATTRALSEHEITTEVDRYIAWPGQALAYKLGEMQIRRHRREAEAEARREVRPAQLPRRHPGARLGAAAGAGAAHGAVHRRRRRESHPSCWSSPRDSISLAGRVPRRDDAVRPGLFTRPACLPAHRDRARRRRRRRPGVARHGRREQLAAAGRKTLGARCRRRGRRRSRAAGRRCFRALDRSRGGIRARRREDRRERD